MPLLFFTFLPSLLPFIHMFCLPLILCLIHTFLSICFLLFPFCVSLHISGHHKFTTCFVSRMQATSSLYSDVRHSISIQQNTSTVNGVLRYDTLQYDRWVPAFWTNLLLPSSGTRNVRSIQLQCHISYNHNLNNHQCGYLKTYIKYSL